MVTTGATVSTDEEEVASLLLEDWLEDRFVIDDTEADTALLLEDWIEETLMTDDEEVVALLEGGFEDNDLDEDEDEYEYEDETAKLAPVSSEQAAIHTKHKSAQHARVIFMADSLH